MRAQVGSWDTETVHVKGGWETVYVMSSMHSEGNGYFNQGTLRSKEEGAKGNPAVVPFQPKANTVEVVREHLVIFS